MRAANMRAANMRLYEKHKKEYHAIYEYAKNLWEKDSVARALAMLRQHERNHPAGTLFTMLRGRAEQILGITGTNDEKRRFLPIQLFFSGEKSRSAVFKEAAAIRRIPDFMGEKIAEFNEGHPVLVINNSEISTGGDSWYRVTANDNTGISGWVQKNSIIFY
jgi:hypothetical protein